MHWTAGEIGVSGVGCDEMIENTDMQDAMQQSIADSAGVTFDAVKLILTCGRRGLSISVSCLR